MNSSQYLTAVFELLPTRRKAVAMERVRSIAEGVFWEVVAEQKIGADVVAGVADKKERRIAWRDAESRIARATIARSTKNGLSEPVAQGLTRDISMAVGSYVELRAGGHEAEWPAPAAEFAPDHAAALEQFVLATTRRHEGEARDALATAAHQRGPRPLTIARARDARLVRTGINSKISVVLNVLRASDSAARTSSVSAGLDAATGEVINKKSSKTRLAIPVACSKWHEQKFLSGKAVLRSSIIRRVGERWFMSAQFEFSPKEVRQTGARLGVDRGIVNPVAMAVVSRDGAVLAVPEPSGTEVGQIIRRADERRKAEQKRRGATSRCHVNAVNNKLHELANDIVAEAKQFGAQVIVEKLDGFKQVIVEARPKFSRKGGWRRTLKRAQLGKLELLLSYKLKMAGLPAMRDVVAGGTSITCPACGVRDPKNRPEQDRFHCLSCGFTAHADSVGGVNIARRGVAMQKITKGAKLAPIELDMVTRLRSRDDGGLGPLVADFVAASGLVAVRASADTAYDYCFLGLPCRRGKMLTLMPSKTAARLYSQRGTAQLLALQTGAKRLSIKAFCCDRVLCPAVAGWLQRVRAPSCGRRRCGVLPVAGLRQPVSAAEYCVSYCCAQWIAEWRQP